ncbi:MAG: carbonic anhydrase [Cyanobacteria bacterium P01_G01_bin.49]
MKKLIEGLREFQDGYFRSHRELFEELSHGQHPRILFITCSDSRIDPNLITQAKVGELFVIRNAGNIIPPFGAANGGEGAAIEYAISALNIEQVIVCGHSHCGAMKGLLKMSSLEEKMPLVFNWLKHAEATRRVIQDNYGNLEGEELLEVTVAENVLTQLENLQTYPVIRSRLHQANLSLHGWIYRIETGEVLEYDGLSHDFVAPQSRIGYAEPEYNFHPTCPMPSPSDFKVPTGEKLNNGAKSNNNDPSLPGYENFPSEQAERIYRGSY